MKKIILLYQFNKFYTDKVEKLADTLEYEVVNVSEDKYNLTLAELIGEKEVKQHDEKCEAPGKMAVVAGLEEDSVAAFFSVLSKATEGFDFHKAVITETNINWTADKLYKEVDNKYKEYKRRKKFNKR